MVLGITGGYCSGKSTLSYYFASEGFELLNVDEIGHHALKARKTDIVDAFGEVILKQRDVVGEEIVPPQSAPPDTAASFHAHDPNPVVNREREHTRSHDTEINRRVLGEIVFSHPKKLKMLESIVHPWMKEYIHTYMEANKAKDVVINAALLFFLELDRYCDLVAILQVSVLLRYFRALSRDSFGFIQTWRRMKNEKFLSNKLLNSAGNYAETMYVRNANDMQSLKERVKNERNGQRKGSL